MIRYTDYDSRVIPVLGSGTWDEIDRVQTIDKTGTLNKIKVEEVGTDGVIEYIDQPPSVTYRMTQLEYGNIAFFNKIANKSDSNNTITLNDFKTPTFDICTYLTDDDGTFKGTLWIPKLRVSGFSINIGSPTGLIERNFDMVGEDWIQWQGANKYLIYKEHTVESGEIESGGTVDITVSNPSAVLDPDTASTYILRVARIRAGVGTELIAGTDYSYSAPTLTVESVQTDDIIKYWYTSGSYISAQTPFTTNTSDLPGIHANSASVYLESGNYIYRLQSVTLDVRFDREDKHEIGNDEVVQRGIRTKTVTISKARTLEGFTLEEILAGQATAYGKLDIRKFTDKLTLRVKFFSNSDKTTFKIGFKCVDLAPSEIGGGTSVGNYVEQRNTLTGQDCTISSVEATIDA